MNLTRQMSVPRGLRAAVIVDRPPREENIPPGT